MDGRTDNVKTVYPPQTKFAEGIVSVFQLMGLTILGRVGTHIFLLNIFFSGKMLLFYAFHNA